MSTVVYALCALTSIGCAVLLLRSWSASRLPLLLWTALGFCGLAVNNILLFVDVVVLPHHDLLLLRDLSALAAVSVLLLGLILETR